MLLREVERAALEPSRLAEALPDGALPAHLYRRDCDAWSLLSKVVRIGRGVRMSHLVCVVFDAVVSLTAAAVSAVLPYAIV